MKTYEDIGIQIPQIYLPRKGTDLSQMGGDRLRPVHLRAGVLAGGGNISSVTRPPPIT